MNLILYNSSAEQNRVDKLSYLSEIVQLTGHLRNESSIVNPTITIELNPPIIEQKISKKEYIVKGNPTDYVVDDTPSRMVYDFISKVLSANYARIIEFNRYYFITDIVSVRNNLWEISMTCDVLMSYKTEILNLPVVIARNTNSFNPNIPDDKLPLAHQRNLSVHFGRLNLNNPVYKAAMNVNDGYCYLLGVYQRSHISYTEGDHYTYGASKIDVNDLQVSQDISNSPYTPACAYYALTYKQLMDFMVEISTLDLPSLLFGSASKYVLSVMLYPFSFKSNTSISDTQIIIDNRTMKSTGFELEPSGIENYRSSIVGNPMQVESIDITGIINNLSQYTNYRYLLNKPYSECSLYLPYYGYTDIDLKVFDGETYDSICIYLSYELVNGTAEYRIMAYKYSESGGSNFILIKTLQFQLGIQIPFGASDSVEVARNSISSAMNTIMGGIGIYAAKTALPMYAGSAQKAAQLQVVADINAAADAGALTGKYVNSLISQSLQYVSVESGAGTNYTNFTSCPLFYILLNLAVPNEPEGYANLYGRPSMEYHTLRELSGYTEIDNVHIENIPTATQQELNLIQRMLYTGVLL